MRPGGIVGCWLHLGRVAGCLDERNWVFCGWVLCSSVVGVELLLVVEVGFLVVLDQCLMLLVNVSISVKFFYLFF